jgi:hypothetical protein
VQGDSKSVWRADNTTTHGDDAGLTVQASFSHFFLSARTESKPKLGGLHKITMEFAVVAWPLVARAQQAAMPLIGYLHSGSPAPYAHLVATFHQGLKEAGAVEGKNFAIEYHWAEGRYDRLPALAADLVSRHVIRQCRQTTATASCVRVIFSREFRIPTWLLDAITICPGVT